jgi:ATP-dependent exoDNAse (exonuclease V) beta subunit
MKGKHEGHEGSTKGPEGSEGHEEKAALADQRDRDLIERDLDSTLVVEAAAGTGKTTELVNRIVRVIESGRAEITEIVSMTFTEKAAGELKLRLREALEVARSRRAGPDRHRRGEGGRIGPSDEQAGRLSAAIAQLEEAQISTIHGFCSDLLRERPVEAGVDPLFTVLTETQSRRLYDAAFNIWFQEQLANPPEGIRRSLRRPVFSVFGAAADKDEGPVDRLRNAGWDLIQWRDFTADWQRPPFDRRARVDALVERLQEFRELSKDPDYQYDGFYLDTRPARQLAEEIERTESMTPRDDNRLEAALIDLGRNRQFQRARKGSGRAYNAGVSRDQVARARDLLQSELARFEVDANADLAVLLCGELRECLRRYETDKANAGALDFLDLLLKARNLVKTNEEVRRSFQQRFKRIFVDEFQDTDPLQAEILLLLAADDPSISDWRSIRPVPGKLFIVGDPKQSIYRFRRADVTVYRDVYTMLEQGGLPAEAGTANAGSKRVTLRTSFRARPNIQRAINAAFEPVMNGVRQPQSSIPNPMSAIQSDYVPLEPFRRDLGEQPSVVVLPVPRPYGTQRISNAAIEESLPDAVGAYVDWLINKSGWKVAERVPAADSARPADLGDVAPSAALGFHPGDREHLVPVQARHICLLFRRFTSYGADMTRPYVLALEARNIPHLLVGGRSFHNRAEIETLRAALAAIERPDDELSVFAALRGSLFAIGDEELLEYRHRFGRFHPFQIPRELAAVDAARVAPIVSALELLQRLHRSRNHIPVASTISKLLDATRAHVRFALEHGGEQVLANVLHVAELARQYEADGGISFRGFIDELREQAEDGQAGEAPILEEGSDGVRLMTVHKAKGLEFPVVILADITAKLRPSAASRYLDPASGTCAVRLAGCSPFDLIQHEQDELRRDEAEGVRLAYVAATRARDLLVVPAVGDQAREGWIEPLNRAIYPPLAARRLQVAAPGCAPFTSKDSVLLRPDGDPALPTTVAPGLHNVQSPEPEPQSPNHLSPNHQCVWWDPRSLDLDAEPPLGIRRAELIVKDVPKAIVDAGLADYRSWQQSRDSAALSAAVPSIAAQPATAWANTQAAEEGRQPTTVELIEVPRDEGRPTGIRFGTLVHTALANVSLEADAAAIQLLVSSHSRALGATDEEAASAVKVVVAVLGHPLLERARQAAKGNSCRREVPVTVRTPTGTLIEGTIDLVFKERDRWTVVDFKTDEELRRAANYSQQVGLYSDAVRASTGEPADPVLMRV